MRVRKEVGFLPLTPTNVNLIVLYGQQALQKCDELLTHWQAILQETDWQKFIFIVVGEAFPALSPEHHQKLLDSGSMFALSSCEENIDPIIDEIRKRMEPGTSIQVQCFCTDLAQHHPSVETLRSLLDRLATRLYPLTPSCILYLVLRSMPNVQSAQSAFAKAVCKPNDIVYLVSDIDNAFAGVPEASLLRALYGELLANSANLRVLPRNQLFSLGYATLNANDSELADIKCHLLSEWFQKQTNLVFSKKELWCVLTQCKDGSWPDIRFQESVEDWLQRSLEQDLKTCLPNEAALKNARILASIEDRSPEELHELTRTFYELNLGTDEQLHNRMQGRANKLYSLICARLSRKLNVNCVPKSALSEFTDALLSISQDPLPLPSVDFLPKKPLESRYAYALRCRMNMEAKKETWCQKKLLVTLAKALYTKFEELSPFFRNAQSLTSLVRAHCLTPDKAGLLSIKYPSFTEKIRVAITSLPPFASTPEPLLDEFGQPSSTAWNALMNSCSLKITEDLPPAFQSSFCKAINQEYQGDQLQNFFDNYLAHSTRMLSNIHDIAQAPDGIFFADNAFAENPWFNRQKSIFAYNDNVEVVNLYTLGKTLEDYLQDTNSLYFTTRDPEKETEQAGGFVQRLAIVENNCPVALAQQKEPESNTSANSAQEKPQEDHRPRIERVGSQYLLRWDWPNYEYRQQEGWTGDMDVPAIITLAQNGISIELPSPVTSADYNKKNGYILPALKQPGPVNISVSYQNQPYINATITGRKNIVRYYIVRNSNYKSVQQLQLDPTNNDDLNHIILSDGKVLYPLASRKAKNNIFCFTNLSLSAQAELVPSPKDPYPLVDAERATSDLLKI